MLCDTGDILGQISVDLIVKGVGQILDKHVALAEIPWIALEIVLARNKLPPWISFSITTVSCRWTSFTLEWDCS